MLHFAHQSALQADHVGRQRVVQYLAPTVIEDFIAKGPSFQDGVKMLAAGALTEEAYSRIDAQFIDLERFHELEFILRELAQTRTLA
jgi:hypothetical protein